MSDTMTLSQMQDMVQEPRPAKPQTDSVGTVALDRAIQADSERRESERLERRRHIRRQIAERELTVRQLSDLAEQLRLLDVKADNLADEHQSKAEPIQEALATATGDKRHKLLQKLADENFDLEHSLAVLERCRGPLVKQHREVRSAVAGLPTESFLAGKDVASPSLLCEQFAAQKRQAAATARVEQAREQLATWQSELKAARMSKVPRRLHGWAQADKPIQVDVEAVHTLTQRVRRWQCELTHASQEQHAAEMALQEIGRDLIAE